MSLSGWIPHLTIFSTSSSIFLSEYIRSHTAVSLPAVSLSVRAGTTYRVTSAAVVAYAASAYMINYDSVAFFESLESFALFDDVSAGFVPEVGESSPPMILRSVDLPQPFSPVISTSSAPPNSRSTLSRAFTQAFQLRYSLVIPLRLIFIFPLPFPFLSKRIKRKGLSVKAKRRRDTLIPKNPP